MTDKKFNKNLKSYSYKNRKGVMPVTWLKFHELCKTMTPSIAKYAPDIILGVARGGLYPATLLSHILQKELYPIRLTRRVNDQIKYRTPKWLTEPPRLVKGKKVLIVDEISDTGETLLRVKEKVKAMKCADVKTAVLYAHFHSEKVPDFVGVVTDKLILNPWDREIYKNKKFMLHPEYEDALSKQK